MYLPTPGTKGRPGQWSWAHQPDALPLLRRHRRGLGTNVVQRPGNHTGRHHSSCGFPESPQCSLGQAHMGSLPLPPVASACLQPPPPPGNDGACGPGAVYAGALLTGDTHTPFPANVFAFFKKNVCFSFSIFNLFLCCNFIEV